MGPFELTMHQIHFRPGFAPDPTGGAYDNPQTPSQLGRGYPPLDTFGASNSVPIFHRRFFCRLTLWCVAL